ncbi:MAG TPA: DUF4232 domain-containing protein [Streptosporangiaceae bacterium]
MALPLSPASRSGARRIGGNPRRAPARLSSLTWPAALAALVCCGLAACGSTAAPGAGATHTVTVQAGSSATPAGGSTPTTAPASRAPAGPARCPAAALKGSLGTSQGAAGTIYTDVVLTNSSAASCTLYGYPGVSFVSGPGGSQIGAPANRNPISPTTLVTLAPGGKANLLIALTDVGVYSPSQCQPTSVSWLRVYPPDDFDSLYVQYATQTCALSTKVVMTVSAVRAGLTGTGA